MLRPAVFTALYFLLATCCAVAAAPPGFQLPERGSDRMVSLQDFQGQVVYVDFWASWCGPCRQSLPLYEEMSDEFPADQFQLVAINLDEVREDAELFLERHPVSYTVLLDPAGATAQEWAIQAMPSSFLLGRDGTVVKSWAGFKPSHIDEIRDEIQKLLE